MTLVFTNGCFDLIHAGHVDFLQRARALGDRLVVGLNSDASVSAIRGPGRPLVPQDARVAVLRALRSVDEVVIFDELTPARLIDELAPDVLVKGGDWPVAQIVGADIVMARGGRVLSLPLLPGYSTSSLIDRVRRLHAEAGAGESVDSAEQREDLVGLALREHQATICALERECGRAIRETGDVVASALRAGKKLFLCGNGGSAAEAQHIAAELAGRFERERRSYPALALTVNTSNLTAIGNDYGFDEIFARQLLGLAGAGDVLVAISTSGESQNVLAAVMAARRLGCLTIALTGAAGKRLAALCDHAVMVPSARTARIQEAHTAIGHIWCELLDATEPGWQPVPDA